MHSEWFRSNFLKVSKFLQIKQGTLISGGSQFCRKSEFFVPRFCISILKVLWTLIFHHSLDSSGYCLLQEYVLGVVNFLQIKEGGSNFCGEPVLQKVWIIWFRLLYFNFKRFMETTSASFIRLQCILYDSGVLFSKYWNFYKLRRGSLISGGNQFCRMSELFGSLFCISIFKVF